MFFPEDFPRQGRRLPRALAEHIMSQVEDPASLGRWDNPAYQLITLILIRCGLRISDATGLPAGCLAYDSDGAPYLRYYNRKMKREALVPIDEELESLIGDQRERNGPGRGGTPVLFPRPNANIDGHRPIAGGTYRDALGRWLAACDVRDEHGQPVRLTPHQWRHTLGTRLINKDVPQHVVQKILDHDSPLMTAHYARLSDKTVREHWEKARKVNAAGQPVQISPDGPLGDAAWAKQRLSRATQALPNGYCQLPVVKTCPHANACLTCPMFVTTPEFLPQHHAQQAATLQLITAAEAAGHARVAEMNKQVAVNLDKIITALEAGGENRRSRPPMRPDPLCRSRGPAARAHPVQGHPGAPRARPGRHPRHLRRRRVRSRDLPVLALHPARHPRPDPAAARHHRRRPPAPSPPASGRPTRRCAARLAAALQRNRQLADENAGYAASSPARSATSGPPGPIR